MSLSPAFPLFPYFRAAHGAFHNLPPETLSDLDAISALVEYRDGDMLMRQGDPPHYVRILSAGRAKISTSSQSGKSLLLNIVSAGAILGLVAAVRRMNCETTAEAHGACIVNKIADQDFLGFLFRHRDANWQVMQMLAEEHHELLVNARRVALSGTVAGNVAKLLLDWGATLTESNGTKHFNMVLTHQEISEMVGTTRETVTRTLANFREHGWISIHGASVEILQQKKMQDISI